MDRKRHKGTNAHNQRVHINCFNIVFTCVILIFANSLASGRFTDRINKISNDLNRSLGAALDYQVTNYTSIYENVTFVSTTTFNARGMAVLYNVTTKFMDLIASKDIYPEGLIKVEDGHLKLGSLEEQWQSILAHYGALLAIVIILLLFAIFMPICGFFFCCCRCCGKCGARSKPFDKKGDLCKKICLASLLICVGTLLLFGVVCAFVTNEALKDHTYELAPSLKNSVRDTDSYLMYTGRQVHGLLTINYQEFESRLFITLENCSDIVLQQLEEYSNATSLSEIIEIVEGLEDIQKDLKFVETTTKELQANASQLADGLRIVRYDLLNILKDCKISECDKLSNDYISKLKADINFDKLPDISEQLRNLNNVLETGIKDAITHGKMELDKIRNEINSTVNSQLPDVKDHISSVGFEIKKYGANISSMITNGRDSLHKYIDSPIDDMDKYIREYTPYRYYLGIAVACILLLVSLCITLGLICGICGKRPDAYGDDCCNKGAGSRFLMLGVAIMFLFSIVLAVVAIAYFFTGILAQRLACDSLQNPTNSQVIQLLDQVLDLKENVGTDVKVSSVLRSIHKNSSIYYTFQLQKYIDLDEVESYMDKFEIEKTFDELKKKIKANTENIKLITPEAKQQLEMLINSGIDEIKFEKFAEELKRSLTTVDLSFLAGKLDDLVTLVNDKYPSRKDITTSLLLSSLHLRTYQTNLIIPMTDKSLKIIDTVGTLEKSFKSDIIKNLVEELETAETYLQVNGTDTMVMIAGNFAVGLEKQVRSYLDRTIVHVKDHLGTSEPISLVLNATLVATCDKIILPWNGFWFSIFWCLLLFIPAIILSVKLAGLYQKYEAYPGPLVEAEYLYDAYAERDNIPLSSSRNDKRFKKKKKHKRLDGRGAYVAEPASDHSVAREVPSGSARYADMAPKHWEEFPAGGPPHYQRAPTEYERPPPYYYPENSGSK